jgi:hypothetical protein
VRGVVSKSTAVSSWVRTGYVEEMTSAKSYQRLRKLWYLYFHTVNILSSRLIDTFSDFFVGLQPKTPYFSSPALMRLVPAVPLL